MKKNLTLITTRFPWPLTNGFANKNYWLIKGLSEKYDVNLHVIQRGLVSSDSLDRIKDFCKTINVYRPSAIEIIYGFFRALKNDWPIQLAFFYSSRANRAIRLELRDTNIALFSVIRGAQYMTNNFLGAVVCDLADSLGQLYLRDAKNFSFLKRLVYAEEGRRMLKYEKSIVNRANQIFFFNASEAAAYNTSNVKVIPHGVDPQLFTVDCDDHQCSDGVVIFGKMNFEPNVQSVFWFANYVLDKLPAEIKLYVIGANPSYRLLRLANENDRIKILGYVENPYPLIRGSIANISPIQMGGGIQNKVIEGLAIGALGLISPLAAKPMENIEVSGLIVCNTPDDWVSVIVKARKNPNFFIKNRLMGRSYAKAYFSWVAYSREIDFGISKAIESVSLGGTSSG